MFYLSKCLTDKKERNFMDKVVEKKKSMIDFVFFFLFIHIDFVAIEDL